MWEMGGSAVKDDSKIKIYENSSREEEQKERKIKDRTEKKENINKGRGEIKMREIQHGLRKNS